MTADGAMLAQFRQRMEDEDLPEVAIQTFAHYYEKLARGETGLLPEDTIRPVREVVDAGGLPTEVEAIGREALTRSVLLKLNGGLGTSMGLDRAKSLLQVKGEHSFLDILARQAVRSGARLVLMNSFNTQKDSLAVLARYPELESDIPLDFLQHKVPKILASDLSPCRWPQKPELEWCPPGHGDVYTALVTTGMLDSLIDAGYHTAFLSNGDNLGAHLDPTILGHFVQSGAPFMMEVADRTKADRKGGHLAELPSGQLILRESAQCADEDADAFQDTAIHRFFNTNNLWVSLPALRALMRRRQNVLGLAMIVNKKTVDPRDASSPAVYQLETAMGAAIAVFEGARAIRVPRTRFAPVKTTSDLLLVRSDAYRLDDDFRVLPAPASAGPVVTLDPDFYRRIDDMEARFPSGPPSLVECRSLQVVGDVVFGGGVTARGEVKVIGASDRQSRIPDGAVLEGEVSAEPI